MRLASVFCAVVLLVGCFVDQSFKDVSSQSEHAALVGRRFEVQQPLTAYGIRQHSKADVTYVELMPPPGISGPEVGFKVAIEPGAIVTVKKVLRSNRLWDNPMTVVVELSGAQLPADVPIHLDVFRVSDSSSGVHLNASVLKPLP